MLCKALLLALVATPTVLASLSSHLDNILRGRNSDYYGEYDSDESVPEIDPAISSTDAFATDSPTRVYDFDEESTDTSIIDLPTSLFPPPFFSETGFNQPFPTVDASVYNSSNSSNATEYITSYLTSTAYVTVTYVPSDSLCPGATSPPTSLPDDLSEGYLTPFLGTLSLTSTAPTLISRSYDSSLSLTPVGTYSPKPRLELDKVPLFTPDTLGNAYGGGYDGVPVRYTVTASSSVPSVSDGVRIPVGVPIGYNRVFSPSLRASGAVSVRPSLEPSIQSYLQSYAISSQASSPSGNNSSPDGKASGYVPRPTAFWASGSTSSNTTGVSAYFTAVARRQSENGGERAVATNGVFALAILVLLALL